MDVLLNSRWVHGILSAVVSAAIIGLASWALGLPSYIKQQVGTQVNRSMEIHALGKHENAADVRDVVLLVKSMDKTTEKVGDVLILLQATREDVAELRGEVKAIQRSIERR